ncbi:MAG: EutN/CcmL family microcompartment protein, partial [Actinobacteria bacterium]|nr:EutN/CcmL family microcompartment protein [Actinomycetota bacterium]NIU20604.1 EutN/CcmL family microcompartment protein [Actinomycetota bacterium]NIV57096.1 hypothetical protein [Actinomycetota bacterium]NIX51918.1 hypothetical protein [Actinomycetota bacterium]
HRPAARQHRPRAAARSPRPGRSRDRRVAAMLLARVAGTVVASRKEPRIAGTKLLLLRTLDVDESETGSYVVAVDAVGAGVG